MLREGVITEGYQQPEPFSTNPYWSEEISMGPHLDRKKQKSIGQRPSTGAGSSSVVVVDTTTAITTPAGSSSGPVSPTKENEKLNEKLYVKSNARVGRGSNGGSVASAPLPTREPMGYRLTPDMSTSLPHNWNHKRYQREDEELWSSELSRTSHKLMDAIKHAGSSAGRFIESSLGKDARLSSDDEGESGHYFKGVNPPVNDYHPPILRRAPLKGLQWMVQPPPPAKIMEGKVPVSRGSSVSNSSRRTTPSDNVIDGVPVSRPTPSRGSSASNLSGHITESVAQKTETVAQETETVAQKSETVAQKTEIVAKKTYREKTAVEI